MRIQLIARFALALAAAAASLPASAWEQADKSGIRQVIRTQVKAMTTTDAAAFASTVSPDLRQRFANEDALYGVLIGKIPALESASSVVFGPLKTTDVGLVQLVLFNDGAGQPWSSLFVMEQQEGRWFVKGVQAKKLNAQPL